MDKFFLKYQLKNIVNYRVSVFVSLVERKHRNKDTSKSQNRRKLNHLVDVHCDGKLWMATSDQRGSQ